MISCSGGILLCWRAAASEAQAACREFIEREHMLIALCETEKIALAADHAKLIAELGEGLREELARLSEFLGKQRLDRATVARKLRQFLGKGDCQRAPHDPVHRSANCRAAFDEAARLAEAQMAGVFHCLHFLTALLDNPGARIAQAMVLGGGDARELCHAAAKEGYSFQAHAPAQALVASIREKPKQPSTYLTRYGSDLTQLARDGKIEPLIGRKKELLQLTRTLCRKTKNNPLLLGDPGVGKTAIVRNLALRIAEGKVAAALQDKRLIELSFAAIVAGTKHRGEFEERLMFLLQEAQADPNVVLFFDEIHTMIGAGGSEGGLDAANMMKPALTSGELRCIGCTTFSEYRARFEKDAALERRFQPIHVDEPSPDETLQMLAGLKDRYERHHQVSIEAPALRAAVELSCRHLADRRLPDKALDLLDEACARVKIGTMSMRGDVSPSAVVSWDTVAQVVADWTGVPATQLSGAEQERFRNMQAILGQRVVGQVEAVEKVSQVVALSRAGLRNAKRPVGVFLFLGPTGVGKTELAKALAEFLFGSDDQMIRLDMSEYMEKHQFSRLIGAPPGYIGHDQEGHLTSKLRRKPYSVVLLDEIEKGHPEVFDLFLQLFDEGRLTDSQGRLVDGHNAIFIMTSNLPLEAAGLRQVGFGPPEGDPAAYDTAKISVQLRRSFRPEFLNRIDELVVFSPLSKIALARIARNMLADFAHRCRDRQIAIEFTDEAVGHIAHAGFDPANGARPLARAIDCLVARPIGQCLVSGELKPGDVVR